MPLGEGWAARVSGLYQHRDDYVSNSLTDEKDVYEGYDDRAARVQVQYDSDNFTALFNAHMRSLDGTARLFRANIIQSGSNDLVAGFDPDTISIDGHNRQELNIFGGSVQLKWNFGAVALYSITGYESLDAYSRGDIDGGYGLRILRPAEWSGLHSVPQRDRGCHAYARSVHPGSAPGIAIARCIQVAGGRVLLR